MIIILSPCINGPIGNNASKMGHDKNRQATN
ncbi:hypothetical protein L326_12800 [Yersinia pestis 113]|nr:hypothetical protein L327_12930 [Yersinia pestis S3]ERP72470.1 hypothetical protein L328_12925 [Yersinia pestis 24H]ERP73154.1 hypothetical protein L326_12800 [Yersinia pestis 113]ERP82304.1 hypothetical protein L325_12850 [Yersinia pestis 9]